MSVLIVGAGPVGLATAGELLRRGVPVRVVDRSTSTGIASKAIIVWPRTLEILSGFGVAERMAQTGHRLAGVAFHSGGRPIGQVRVSRLPDSRFNHVLMLPQSETERILLDRFLELGGVVERGVELVELHNRPDRVDAVLLHPDGAREEVTAAWVVGADGAHSTVRRLSGIAFDVLAPNMTFAIADAPIDGRIDESLLHYHYSRHGALGVGPLGDGVFRFAVSVAPDAEPGRELFQAALDQRAGHVGRVGTPRWQATFAVRIATAATFRSGRVFLAGDAAHVLSPAGGQGLNTGFQDAINLSWKLAGVLTGRLRPAVLDTYSDERRDAVRRVSQTTAWQTRWGLLSSPGKVLVRDSLIRAAAGTGVLQHVLAPLFSQTDLRYGRYGSPWRPESWRYPAVRAGGRLPYLPDLNSSAAPILVVSGGLLGDADRKLLCERLLAAAPAPIELVDLAERLDEPAGRLARLLGPEPTALVVRPDGHVLAVAPAGRPDRVFAGLAGLVTPGRTTELEVK